MNDVLNLLKMATEVANDSEECKKLISALDIAAADDVITEISLIHTPPFNDNGDSDQFSFKIEYEEVEEWRGGVSVPCHYVVPCEKMKEILEKL